MSKRTTTRRRTEYINLDGLMIADAIAELKRVAELPEVSRLEEGCEGDEGLRVTYTGPFYPCSHNYPITRLTHESRLHMDRAFRVEEGLVTCMRVPSDKMWLRVK